MNLMYVKGDLLKAALDGHLNVIAHQANCFCKGRRGIAPLIFQTFPNIKVADDATEIGSKEKLGSLSHGHHFFDEGSDKDPLWGFNIYGQYHFDSRSKEYGTRYWALASALEKMATVISTRRSLVWPWDQVLNIGFPLIGCGLAGGDWEVVEEIIKHAFRNVRDINIYIYTLDKLEGKDYVDR